MILTAHQPVYLPWLGFFHKIAASDAYCYFDNVQYLIKDWNNRNKIKTPSGEIWLTVPVLTDGYREKAIKDIEINNSTNWKKKHWKSIYINYKKAPYFDHYADFFENVYKKDWRYLSDINEYMLKWFLNELGIKTKYYKASELNFVGRKSGLVLDMCKKLQSDAYIFGALGKDYADITSFKENNIKIYFQNFKHPIYNQLYGKFSPYMSIIDLLFNCGEKSLEIIMQGNVNKKYLLNNKELYE